MKMKLEKVIFNATDFLIGKIQLNIFNESSLSLKEAVLISFKGFVPSFPSPSSLNKIQLILLYRVFCFKAHRLYFLL